MAYTCTYSVYTCTYTVHGYHVFYACTTTVFCHCILACTTFDIGMYNAALYRNRPLWTCRDIPPIYPQRMAVETTGKIHGIYVYMQCIHMYIHCTWLPCILCMYHYWHYSICHCVLASGCTTFDIGMYNAIIHELTIVYMQGYTSYIPPKNGCWDNW
jgi:hypothetical protein